MPLRPTCYFKDETHLYTKVEEIKWWSSCFPPGCPVFKSPLEYFQNFESKYNHVMIVAIDCDPKNWKYHCKSLVESLKPCPNFFNLMTSLADSGFKTFEHLKLLQFLLLIMPVLHLL